MKNKSRIYFATSDNNNKTTITNGTKKSVVTVKIINETKKTHTNHVLNTYYYGLHKHKSCTKHILPTNYGIYCVGVTAVATVKTTFKPQSPFPNPKDLRGNDSV